MRDATRDPEGVATLVDVARVAEVSIATASRVINGRPYVSEAARARVLEAVERLNFRPSSLARSFRAQRSLTIGMIVPDISSPFYAAALRGAQHTLNRHGYTILICDTEEQVQREHEALDLLAGHRAAGLILAPVDAHSAVVRRLLERQPTALVVIDNRLQGQPADTVLVDNVAGAEALTTHLIGHGHRRIGHLAGMLHETSGADRLAGYRQALQKAGIPYEPALVEEGDWTEGSGYLQTLRLLALPEPPTSLMIASSFMAVGALSALRERGVVVPEGMAVACFDDTPWAPLVEPPLTALSRQDYALGEAAAELILAQLTGRSMGAPQERLLPLELVVRRSCGCTLAGAGGG